MRDALMIQAFSGRCWSIYIYHKQLAYVASEPCFPALVVSETAITSLKVRGVELLAVPVHAGLLTVIRFSQSRNVTLMPGDVLELELSGKEV